MEKLSACGVLCWGLNPGLGKHSAVKLYPQPLNIKLKWKKAVTKNVIYCMIIYMKYPEQTNP